MKSYPFEPKSNRVAALQTWIYFRVSSKSARVTSGKRAGLQVAITTATGAAEALAGGASHDVARDRRHAAFDCSRVGHRNFFWLHAALSTQDVVVDRRGVDFSLQQNRSCDCGHSARRRHLGDAGDLHRRVSIRVLELAPDSSPTRAFSPIRTARLHALARIFAGRLAYLLAGIRRFALPRHPFGDTYLFSHSHAA